MIEEEEDPSGWSVSQSASGRLYYWLRISRRSWTLPVPGHVAGLIAAEVRAAEVGEVGVARLDIHWVSGSGLSRKRIRLNRKKPNTPRGTICACSSTCVEEVALFWVFWYVWCWRVHTHAFNSVSGHSWPGLSQWLSCHLLWVLFKATRAALHVWPDVGADGHVRTASRWMDPGSDTMTRRMWRRSRCAATLLRLLVLLVSSSHRSRNSSLVDVPGAPRPDRRRSSAEGHG